MSAPVVVVGDLMVDVVAAAQEPLAHASDAAARVKWSGGGGAGNVAAWLAAAGVPAMLVTRVGEDFAAHAAIAELAAAGVDVRAGVDPELPTGTCVVVVSPDGERTMLPDRGANAALAPGDLPGDAFTLGGHLHLSGYTLLHPGSRRAGLTAIERARHAGMRISVDPASAAPLLACGPREVLGWLAGVDVLLPNRDEATALTGEADPLRAAAALAGHAAEVVVTLGAAGALWTDGTATIAVDAPEASIVDSTGAGDAFAAGWIAARRAGAEPTEALIAGCVAGARAVGREGARPGSLPAESATKPPLGRNCD